MTLLKDIIKKQLRDEGYDVIDFVPVPAQGDRMVRVRTLEEAIEDFEQNSDGSAISYLVQAKKKTESPSDAKLISQIENKPSLDGIYLPNGRLNAPYLTKNAELLFDSGDYTMARNIYKAILKSGEKSAFAHYWIGRCYEAENKTSEAFSSYEESIAYHTQ